MRVPISTGRPTDSISCVFSTTASNFASSVGNTKSGMLSRRFGLFVGTFVVHRRYTFRISQKFGRSVPDMPASFSYRR